MSGALVKYDAANLIPDTSRLPSARDIANAKLPAAYEHAVAALAACERIDECKTWADKSAALASYGRQSDDERLVKHSMRIQARATRRVGELLEAYKLKASPGRPKKNASPKEGVSQRSVAGQHGISPKRELVAKRAAAIPQAQFDAAVESDSPPTQKQLSDMGKAAVKAAPTQPEGFYEATHLMGALERLADRCAAHEPAFVAGGVKPSEIPRAIEHARAVTAWLATFRTELEGRK